MDSIGNHFQYIHIKIYTKMPTLSTLFITGNRDFRCYIILYHLKIYALGVMSQLLNRRRGIMI